MNGNKYSIVSSITYSVLETANIVLYDMSLHTIMYNYIHLLYLLIHYPYIFIQYINVWSPDSFRCTILFNT